MSYVSTSYEEETTSRSVVDSKRIAHALGLPASKCFTSNGEGLACSGTDLGQFDWPNRYREVAGGFRQLTNVDRFFRRQILGRLRSSCESDLSFADAEGRHWVTPSRTSGNSDAPVVEVLDPSAYRSFAIGGSLGGSEAYLKGQWRSRDLVAVMRAVARHARALAGMERGSVALLRPLRVAANWFRRNNRLGSQKNIAAHYDLSNDFFGLMLDPTMTYSAGIFQTLEDSMQEASERKYDRICRQLNLSPGDRVLEIGCGWGGFAIYAASNYGCHVTATTISKAQFEYAKREVANAGLENSIDLVLKDYRDLQGSFDKLVSIEMIEAVGERFLNTYFKQCSNLLRPDGMMMLQAILIPDDRYEYYRSSVDFIRRFVFPGGFLPAVSAISQSLKKSTDFRLAACDDFGLHYAETLKRWRTRFWNNIQEVRELGFDETFIRTWDYYLCYCEAGFAERQIGVSHLLMLKPGCRDTSAGIAFPQS